ncbi:hypothetical protein LCGC14_2965410, partial [marine sediment metagenome]
MPSGIYIRTKENNKKHSFIMKKIMANPLIREKISKNNARYWKGKSLSQETKEKISKTLKEKYKNGSLIHPMLGKTHTDEVKLKIAESNKTREYSEETKKKISESNKGKKRSNEFKARMAEIQLGKKHSDETKKKLSESHKGNFPSDETRK